MDINIKKLNHSDTHNFLELIKVFEDVFEMKNFKMPEESYLHQLLIKDSFIVFAAIIEDKVVGGLTSYIMPQYYSTAPLVYIFDLAVKTQLQRQGIGKMLIAANNKFCKEIGAEVVMVQADEADDHAINFYQSTGGIAEKVIHFDYQLLNKAP